MSETETSGRTCPVCGTVMDRYVPIAWNCPECDRDYWIEGGSWWYCDVDGEPEIVTAVTDGGETVENEREYVVHWEARVYGRYGTYATSEREAIEKAQDHCVPEREAEDTSGPLEVQFVEDYG